VKANDHPRPILIGELSCRTGVPARLLRYYEEQDLLHPERDSNGYRRYGAADVARQIAAGAAVSAEMVRGYADAFAAAGCDELIFVPTTAAPDQIGLLASAVL